MVSQSQIHCPIDEESCWLEEVLVHQSASELPNIWALRVADAALQPATNNAET